MNIRIEYDGTMAKCYIQDTFGKDQFKEVPFNEADKMSQIFALGAFDCIRDFWKREHTPPKRFAIAQRFYSVERGWGEWSVDYDRVFDDQLVAESAIEDDNLSDTAEYRVVEITR